MDKNSRYGETLDRWKVGVDSMLLKASKDCRAHKMWNVKLIEADCNLNYKKIGKEGMQNGRKLGCSVQRMVEAGNTTEPKKFH